MSGNFKDKFLVSGASAGDEEAFAELYDKYVDSIFRFIMFRVPRREEAQDLTSETFLKAWQYIADEEKEIENFRPLIYRIARNLTIDYYRKKDKEVLALGDEQWEAIIDESVNLKEKSFLQDDLRTVKKALLRAGEEQRELITMRFMQDLRIDEIAQILNKKSGTIRVALHRAIKDLKNILKET